MSFNSTILADLSLKQMSHLADLVRSDPACQAAEKQAMQLLKDDLKVKPATVARRIILRNTAAGFYGDFSSILPTPKLFLMQHLSESGYSDLVQRVNEGRYDSEIDPAVIERLVSQVKSSLPN